MTGLPITYHGKCTNQHAIDTEKEVVSVKFQRVTRIEMEQLKTELEQNLQSFAAVILDFKEVPLLFISCSFLEEFLEILRICKRGKIQFFCIPPEEDPYVFVRLYEEIYQRNFKKFFKFKELDVLLEFLSQPSYPVKKEDVARARSEKDLDPGMAKFVAKLKSSLQKRFVFKKLLGVGTYGIVYQVWDKKNRRYAAFKMLTRAFYKSFIDFLREGQLLASINSESIVKCHEVKIERLDCEHAITYQLLEYDDKNQTLSYWLAEQKNNSESRITVKIKSLTVMKNLLALVRTFVGYKIVHRDIKPDNILIHRENLRLKAIDLGLVKMLAEQEQSMYIVGSALYIPHHELELKQRGLSHNHYRDIFAMALNLFHIYTLEYPFTGNETIEQLNNAKRQMKWEGEHSLDMDEQELMNQLRFLIDIRNRRQSPEKLLAKAESILERHHLKLQNLQSQQQSETA